MKNKYNLAARAGLLALALTAAFAFATSASATNNTTAYGPGTTYTGGGTLPDAILWYNGDFDGRNGGANQYEGQFGAGQFSSVYDNFTGPGSGQSWNVSALFSNNIMDPGLLGQITSANYQIRTGVSAGNGGTLLFSGVSAATVTPTGRIGFGRLEYTGLVSGVSLSLPPLTAGLCLLQ